MDVKSVAQAIVDSQKVPLSDAINKKIDQSNAKISGYSAIRYVLDQLKTAFSDLNETTDLNAVSVGNSQTSAFTATATSSAAAGNHTVEVTQLATSQRSASLGSYASSTTAISGLTSLSLAAGYETSAVNFSALTAGQSVTLNGLTFTATAAMTATNVGAAFASLTSGMTSTAAAAANTTSAALGSYSGTFTAGFTTGTASSGGVTATSISIGAVTNIAGSGFTIATTDGTSSVYETATLTFNALAAGQAVTVNGLKFTATAAMTATQVGAAFASLTSGMSSTAAAAANTTSAALGTYSGTFTAGFTTATNSSGVVTATATAYNDVTDIAGSPSIVTTDATTTTIAISTATPTGVVTAINAVTSTTGVSAQLVQLSSTGAYQIVLSGESGANNAFKLTADDTDAYLTLGTTTATGLLVAAQNAVLTVDGLAVTRSSNTIDDVITGVTLNLNATTTSGTPANLNLTLNTQTVKDKLTNLVNAYNDVQTVLTDVYNKDSKVTEYGASLVGDSTVQLIKSQIRSLFTTNSTSESGTIYAMRDIGITLDVKGKMSLNNTTLDAALTSSYSDVVTMLNNDHSTNYISTSTYTDGVANDGINLLTEMLGTDGVLINQSNNAAKRVTDFQKDLERLNDRMTKLLERYNKQFAAMESFVGQSKSMQTSLTATFKNMSNQNNN
jgi:flagellar hook-associated protein 2